MNAKPLVLVIGLAVLTVVGWFVWHSRDSAVDQPGPGVSQDAGHSSDPADADVGQGGLGADSAASNPEVGAGTVAERSDASLGIDSRSATVTIRGRLVDGDGNGHANLPLTRVERANPNRSDFLFNVDSDAPRKELPTDGDGRFAFELARDHSALLELPDPDVVFVDRPAMIHGHRGPQDLGDIVVRESASVTGVVQDPAGNPVPGVKVTAGLGRISFGTSSTATTRDDGRFDVGRLRPGTWTLRTASARYLPAREEVTVKAGETIADVVLVVAEGNAIAGQVVDDLGRPVAGMMVGAKRVERRGGVEVERFATDESATTDQYGYFVLSGLSGESASLRAFGDGHTTAVAVDVRVGTGDLVMQVDRLGVIEGVLRGADGGPLVGSRVRATAARKDDAVAVRGIEGVLRDRSSSARTAEDGSFRITGVVPGTITVSASGEQHRPVERAGIVLAPAQTVEGVQLVAERGAVANLTVLDEDDRPVAGARVVAHRPPEPAAGNGVRIRSRRVEDNEDEVRVMGEDDHLGSAVTDVEGRAVIAGLAAGSVVFHAEHEDYAPARSVTLPMMPNGNVDATLTVRTPGFAELQISQADGAPADQASYRVRGPLGASDSDSHTGRADVEGRAVVGPLAAGNYVAELVRKPGGHRIGDATLSWSGEESRPIANTEQRFEVAAGKTSIVKIRRPVLTRIYGVVTGAEGPVAGAAIEIERDSPNSGGRIGAMAMGGGRSTTAEPDGSFAISDVESGDYVLRYGRPGQIVKAETRISVPPELPELLQDLVLRTGTVRVQAWSEVEGKPIANAAVELRKPSTGQAGERRETRIMMVSISSGGDSSNDTTMMTFGAQRAKTDDQGWAEIEDVPAGDYELRMTHDAHAPATHSGVVVSELQTTDVGRVGMKPAGDILGKVIGPDGKVVRMGLVFYRPIDGEEGQPTPAMGGTFTLSALKPGRYVLRAQEIAMGPAGGGPGKSSPEVEVEVKAGETATAELRLPEK